MHKPLNLGIRPKGTPWSRGLFPQRLVDLSKRPVPGVRHLNHSARPPEYLVKLRQSRNTTEQPEQCPNAATVALPFGRHWLTGRDRASARRRFSQFILVCQDFL